MPSTTAPVALARSCSAPGGRDESLTPTPLSLRLPGLPNEKRHYHLKPVPGLDDFLHSDLERPDRKAPSERARLPLQQLDVNCISPTGHVKHADPRPLIPTRTSRTDSRDRGGPVNKVRPFSYLQAGGDLHVNPTVDLHQIYSEHPSMSSAPRGYVDVKVLEDKRKYNKMVSLQRREAQREALDKFLDLAEAFYAKLNCASGCPAGSPIWFSVAIELENLKEVASASKVECAAWQTSLGQPWLTTVAKVAWEALNSFILAAGGLGKGANEVEQWHKGLPHVVLDCQKRLVPVLEERTKLIARNSWGGKR